MKKTLPVLLQISTLSLLFVSLMFSAIGVRPAHAATTWTVTSTDDDATNVTGACPDANQCSLRKAISLATVDDTIVFDAALSGQTIYLEDTLTVSNIITIDGSSLAVPITISGDTDNNGDADLRLFKIDGVTVTLKRLTLVKGAATSGGGGAILNNGGTIIVNDSTFTSNTTPAGGGAIYNASGTAIITNSSFSSNTANVGGAIYNIATLNVTGSTFTGNGSTFAGGAINSTSNTAIKSSTFESNSAGTKGGAISSSSASTVISNSTFYSNSATTKGGGIYTWVSGIAITSSTFSGNWAPPNNGGGIYNDGPMELSNTILANSLSGGDCKNGSGNLSINTNNLTEDGSCGVSLSGDPKLGALTNNGGPTRTMALMGNSPAVDAGNDAACAASPVSNLDQRGVTRPIGSHCDIGAFESRFTRVTYLSNGAEDGWVLESSENSNQGNFAVDGNTTFFLGDTKYNQQYRGILSFTTSALPDTALVTSVLLKFKRNNNQNDPTLLASGFVADVKTGSFGAVPLESTDFQAPATATYKFPASEATNDWFTLNLTNAKTHINKMSSGSGLTQVRLYFKLDDNNDKIANYIYFISGDGGVVSRPQLVIQYYVP